MAERSYQTLQVEEVVEKVSEVQKVLVHLPTGGGKTYEFSLITKRFIINTNKSVLILVHREELMYQSAKTIKKLTGFDPYLITSKTKKFNVSRVYIGMVESTVSRLNMFHNVGLVIIDECHMANFNKIHSIFLEELIIGFTATPISSSKKEPLNKYYNAIVLGPQIPKLIELGYLAQNWTRCPKDIVDAEALEIDKKSGDFNESKMAFEYKKPRYITNVIDRYTEFCGGKKTLIFNVTIDHSKEVNACFVACGYNSRHLDSESNKRPSSDPNFENERQEILHWFKITEDAILNNIMIATVGFDEPTVQNVILNFSTLSIVKFIQCAGRGGRIIDDEFITDYQILYPYNLESKRDFNIIDMGGNAARLGDWNDERDWKWIFDNPEKPPKEGGVAPAKICPSCSALVHAAARVCLANNQKGDICGYQFIREEKAEAPIGEMILFTKINIPEIIDKYSKKYPYYTMFELANPVIADVFEMYEEPSETVLERAFNHYYELCIDWYSRTLAKTNGNVTDITESAWHIKRAKLNFDQKVEIEKQRHRLKLQSIS